MGNRVGCCLRQGENQGLSAPASNNKVEHVFPALLLMITLRVTPYSCSNQVQPFASMPVNKNYIMPGEEQ